MPTALLALVAAFVFGAADFIGGFASKRMNALLVTGVTAFSGFILLLLFYPFLGGSWIGIDIAWGLLSGAFGAVAIALLYACLAVGPMSILSPLTALISAIVPVLWGTLVDYETLSGVSYLALGIALVAIVLVGFVPEKGALRPTMKGLFMAIGSGAAIGGFFICINQTSHESGVVPLIANRIANASIMAVVLFAVFLVRRLRNGGVARLHSATPRYGSVITRLWRTPGFRLAVLGGAADVVANVLVLFALRSGELSVTSVLSALYPAGTILLAAVILRERIAPVQWIGLVLAISSVALLSAS